MKTKIIWLAVSCLIVASLLLVSCAPEAVGREEEVVSPEEEAVPEEEEEVSLTPAPSKARGTINLVNTGKSRKLPVRLLGFQAVPLYEHLTDTPAKVAIAKEMVPAFVRFPGGMVGNYYSWRSGQLELNVKTNSSATYRFFARVAEQIKQLHPQGVFIESYYQFSQAIGAEIVLLVNLETSSIGDQVEWVKKMKSEGILPRYLELGNEFWLAMLGDPNVLKKWPDTATTMRVMKEYRDALQPFFAAGTKVAVQAAANRFYVAYTGGKLVQPTALKNWDDSLKPEPWFDAVTIHLYPDIDRIAGVGLKETLPENMDTIWPAVMARCDQGVDEAISTVERQLPGKEIWITEWSGYQWGGTNTSEPVFHPLGLHSHMTTRMLMAFLRHSSVTMAHYHMLNFSGGPMSLYRYDTQSGSYVPISSAIILKWFNQAANGGATYQRLKVDGARWINSSVTAEEGYYDIEAVQFQKGNTTTIIVHNAGHEVKRLPVSGLVSSRLPTKIESTVAVPTDDYSSSAPPVQEIVPAEEIEVPAYSVTRMVWE